MIYSWYIHLCKIFQIGFTPFLKREIYTYATYNTRRSIRAWRTCTRSHLHTQYKRIECRSIPWKLLRVTPTSSWIMHVPMVRGDRKLLPPTEIYAWNVWCCSTAATRWEYRNAPVFIARGLVRIPVWLREFRPSIVFSYVIDVRDIAFGRVCACEPKK